MIAWPKPFFFHKAVYLLGEIFMGFVLFLKFVARNDPVTLKYYHEITDHEYVLLPTTSTFYLK